MLKDKPGSYEHPSAPSARRWRGRRLWLVAGLVVLAVFYFLHSSTAGNDAVDVHHAHGTKRVDWSRFAYSQYATDQAYLCNAVMVFEALHRLHSKADRVLFYPSAWDTIVHDSKDRTSQLLVLARDAYGVKLRPTVFYTFKRDEAAEKETWDASINKLHAFELVEYERVIHLDSDITLLKHLDELFFLPSAPAAMPRAYWNIGLPDQGASRHKLTSLLIVLEPSKAEAEHLWDVAAGVDNSTSEAEMKDLVFDMEILNQRFEDSALVLPHRKYALVTGEFRRTGETNHSIYLGNKHELWDADKALGEASLVHFSDWPLPKPWIMWPNNLYREIRPQCDFDAGTSIESGCRNREVWKDLYDQFKRRRKDVCKLLSVPAPEWPPKEKPRKPSPKTSQSNHAGDA